MILQANNDSWSNFSTSIGQGHWRAVDYHPQAGLIMAGGNSRWSKIVEQSKNYGHTFRRLADIPYAGTPSWYGVLGACLVIINETTAVLIGGRFNLGSNIVHCNVDFLDLASNQWTSGPTLTTCRYQHSCSLITNPSSGQREIVVVGGHNHLVTDCVGELNSTEIINIDTKTVRSGPSLPQSIRQHSTINYDGTFLIIGGLYSADCGDTTQAKRWLHRYNKQNETWDWRIDTNGNVGSNSNRILPGQSRMATAMFVGDLCD